MTTIALKSRRHRSAKVRSEEQTVSRRLNWVWSLLFLNVLSFGKMPIVFPLPHKIGQLLTQGALVAAFLLALSVNPKLTIRPNVFLALYSLLAVMSLIISIRVLGLGTTYRAFRLVGFVAVLWLLTPWWGRRDLILARSQMRFIGFILASTLLGLLLSPSKALTFAAGGKRLDDAIWPMPATQVAHFVAELTGLTILMWMCRMLRGRTALLILVPSVSALIATHTRTALFALLVALLVSSMSLYVARRRVRRTLMAVAVMVVAVVLPLSPLISTWLVRGESSTEVSDLSGRTEVWPVVLSEPKPETNKIFGSGLSNGGVVGAQDPSFNGLPIDSGWVASYQDQGIVGWVLEATMFLVLMITALTRPRGPARAMALFLIVYCLFASFTESGLGEASAYLLDLTVAASLLVPPWGLASSAPTGSASEKATISNV